MNEQSIYFELEEIIAEINKIRSLAVMLHASLEHACLESSEMEPGAFAIVNELDEVNEKLTALYENADGCEAEFEPDEEGGKAKKRGRPRKER